jgi:iron complex transport system permease protein
MELSIGAVRIPVTDIIQILTRGHADRITWERIILEFRLPRALNALVSGAALGACGLLMQTLFKNPLADPYVLGIIHGARFAVAIVVVISGAAGTAYASRFGMMGSVGMTLAASAGALAIMLLLMAASRRARRVTLLVVGLMIGYTCTGLISAVLHFTTEAQVKVFETWNGGSFDGITRGQLQVLIPIVIAGLAGAYALAKPMDVLLLGENYAQTMGISIKTVRITALICIALLAGSVTAFSGPIPFLGLIAAHICRGLLRTSDHRSLIPAVALMGAILGLTTDLVIHLPWSKHFLHLDAVIGMIGGPVALWVILRRRNAQTIEA